MYIDKVIIYLLERIKDNMRVLVSWSTGKDSAWMLHTLTQDPNVEVVGLFCTINKHFDRVSLHGVRSELLRQQAEHCGLPLHTIELPFPCSYNDYDVAMRRFIEKAKKENIEYFAFGDLYLGEVRKSREDMLHESGIKPLFPIWGIPTKQLSRDMVLGGLKAVIVCLNPDMIDKNFSGAEYNNDFLDNIPDNIDPCGENGEFHTFAFAGPMFQKDINIIRGETVYRENLYFTDIIANKSKTLISNNL